MNTRWWEISIQHYFHFFYFFGHATQLAELHSCLRSKESTCQCSRHRRPRFDPWVGKIPWGRKWQPTPEFLPRKPHGQRSLAGYSPQGHKELDTTEQHTQWHEFSPWTSQVALVVKNLPAKARDIRGMALIPASGRSPRGGHGKPLQYSCLGNSLDKGACGATVHRIAKSWPQLKQLSIA